MTSPICSAILSSGSIKSSFQPTPNPNSQTIMNSHLVKPSNGWIQMIPLIVIVVTLLSYPVSPHTPEVFWAMKFIVVLPYIIATIYFFHLAHEIRSTLEARPKAQGEDSSFFIDRYTLLLFTRFLSTVVAWATACMIILTMVLRFEVFGLPEVFLSVPCYGLIFWYALVYSRSEPSSTLSVPQ